MKTKNYLFSALLIISSVLFLVSSCEKDDNEPSSGNITNGKTTALFNPDVTYGTMTDQDGNVYKTVTIGTQTWMAENLRTTKYNDGTNIPNVTGNNEWGALTTGAHCNYKNTSNIDSIATYGRLYNWYAVNTGKLAPKGWHVPTNLDWNTLITYLGGESAAGGKIKETGTTHWFSPNAGATNETGFTALPGGYCINGLFDDVGFVGTWWSANEYGPGSAWRFGVDADGSTAGCNYLYKHLGFSIRCVRD